MYNIWVNSKLCRNIIIIIKYIIHILCQLTDTRYVYIIYNYSIYINSIDCAHGDNRGHIHSCHIATPVPARSVYGWPWVAAVSYIFGGNCKSACGGVNRNTAFDHVFSKEVNSHYFPTPS